MHSRYRCALLVAALAALTPPCPALTLEQALQQAVQQSATPRAGEAALRSAAELARAAGQQPDPTLTLGLDNLPVTGRERLRTGAEDMTMKRIGIAQEWVSADKRAARETLAQAQWARERVQQAQAVQQLRERTALAYVEAYFAGLAVQLAGSAEQLAREEAEVGQGRLRAAAGSSADALSLAAARSLTGDEADELRQQQALADTALRRWLRAEPQALEAPAWPEAPAEAGFIERHPEVLARRQAAEIARREVELARLNRKPNWTYEVAYGQRQGRADLLSVGLSIPLAIAPAARQDRETAARLAQLEQAEAELEEAQRAAASEHATLSAEAQRLQARIERLTAQGLPLAEQRVATSLAAYRAGRAELSLWFEARRAELELRRRLLGLQREQGRVQAQLTLRALPEGVSP